MHKSFLKWPGGKSKLIGTLTPHLVGKRLVEPFVGAGNVFLNIEFDEYLLCDSNSDLINTFQVIAKRKEKFIADLKKLFEGGNDSDVYYKRRNRFNLIDDDDEKALLFIYLNRHGFNGLCRYSKKTGYNVPFGSYAKVYFPEDEIKHFLTIADKCTFKCQTFEETFSEVKQGDVVYCDPPYFPINSTSFTNYVESGFTLKDQQLLGELSGKAKVPVLVSNSDCERTRAIYRDAKLLSFSVQRNISRKGDERKKEPEILAIFKPKKK